MSLSFREVANFMDSVVPPTGIRQLARTHRWPGGQANTPLSLRVILSRHRHANKVTLNFLFYNTFLLHGEVPITDFIIETMITDVPVVPAPIDPIDDLKE